MQSPLPHSNWYAILPCLQDLVCHCVAPHLLWPLGGPTMASESAPDPEGPLRVPHIDISLYTIPRVHTEIVEGSGDMDDEDERTAENTEEKVAERCRGLLQAPALFRVVGQVGELYMVVLSIEVLKSCSLFLTRLFWTQQRKAVETPKESSNLWHCL